MIEQTRTIVVASRPVVDMLPIDIENTDGSLTPLREFLAFSLEPIRMISTVISTRSCHGTCVRCKNGVNVDYSGKDHEYKDEI